MVYSGFLTESENLNNQTFQNAKLPLVILKQHKGFSRSY